MHTSKLALGLMIAALATGLASTGCDDSTPVVKKPVNKDAPAFEAGQGETPQEQALVYPAGPYGHALHSVVPPFQFLGFHNPKVADDPNALESISLSYFYNPTGEGTFPADGPYRPGEKMPKVLWLDVSASWCPPCQQESQSVLPKDYAKYQPQGAEILLELVQDPTGGPAAPVDLVNWTKKYKTAWPAFIDPDALTESMFSEEAFPANILIDARTMTIQFQVAGEPAEGSAFYTKLEHLLAN